MYINVYKIILLVCMCCVGICWISCSGNSDDSEQTEVILSVDKNTLTADGKDIITFTVMHAGIDVTADAISWCQRRRCSRHRRLVLQRELFRVL